MTDTYLSIGGSKFPDEDAAAYWEESLDGGPDDEYGTSQGNGWFGLLDYSDGSNIVDPDVRAVILSEDSDGFVSYATFDTIEEAHEEFERLRDVTGN